jgi:hypothetical protein
MDILIGGHDHVDESAPISEHDWRNGFSGRMLTHRTIRTITRATCVARGFDHAQSNAESQAAKKNECLVIPSTW